MCTYYIHRLPFPIFKCHVECEHKEGKLQLLSLNRVFNNVTKEMYVNYDDDDDGDDDIMMMQVGYDSLHTR